MDTVTDFQVIAAGKFLRIPLCGPAPPPRLRLSAKFWDLEGRCKATWEREFKHPGGEAGPLEHLNDKVDSDQ